MRMTCMKSGGMEAKRADNDYGMRLARTTSFGRKRVALPNICTDFDDDGADRIKLTAPAKRRCIRDSFSSAGKSPALEDLPQEILIRILCGAEHADLKSLILVSKAMRDATVIAKQTHFAYSTPRKMTNLEENDEVETPEAPRAERRRRLSSKKMVGISVKLFASDNKYVGPLLLEMETNLIDQTVILFD